ncbi:MAG TPA: ribokinase [Clostridiaceae bacterium]|nr:ribokinase [Clostridiaceae bacterium]
MTKHFDLACLGPVSRDYNVEPDGSCEVEIGGAIVYSPYAARAAGADCVALVKGGGDVPEVKARFDRFDGTLNILPSAAMTSIENRYLDASHEERISSLKSQADPFILADVEGFTADIYHLAGLVYGDFSDQFICEVAERGDVALDVQCLLRHGVPGEGAMTYEDWATKQAVLPRIKYLKVDAKEARIMTGTSERHAGAKMLQEWGPEEVFVSFHNQMLVYDGTYFYECDYTPISLVGRTGRGDTVFASYLAYRKQYDIATALRFATALVVLKMRQTGPYLGDHAEVKAYADEHLAVNVTTE